jgi:hypothetical protein
MRLPHYVLISLLLATGGVQAQIVKSTVLGTVRDSSGAVVPKVKISVKNVDTNIVSSTLSDASGDYHIPFLNSGTYTATAELTGFETAVQSSFNLDVATSVRVDFTMVVGNVSERVSVSSASPLVQTDTSSVGVVVTSQTMEQLPLLGRNYQQLAELAPTAVSPISNPNSNYVTGLSTGNYFQVAGQRGAYTAYTIDGIDANNYYVQTQSIVPSLDSLEQFSVQTHNFSAEYGRGTVQFTATTKTGTNEFHGSLYEYVRNDILNANDFFANRADQPKAKFRYNQFGGTIGGPVRIPKIYSGKDRTFFFFSYEGTRYRLAGVQYALVPDPDWLTGDFSGATNSDGSPLTIYDPATTAPNGAGGYTRTPFPGNVIPKNRLNPVAAAMLPFIPAPNAAVGTLPGNDNLVGSAPTNSNVNFWALRIDHRISASDSIYGRYMQSLEGETVVSILPLSGTINNNRGRNVMVAETHAFGTQTVNEIRLGYNRGNYQNLQEGAYGSINYVDDVFHLKNIGGGPNTYGLPSFSWTGYSTIGGNVDDPQTPLSNTWQLSDNIIKSFGKHSVKAGFDLRKQQFDINYGTFNRGQFTFNGQYTQLPTSTNSGNVFADFDLGLASLTEGLSGSASGAFHAHLQNYFAQDDWRLSKRLTLNLGLRYEYYSPWSEETGKATVFQFGSDVGSCFGAACPFGQILPSQPGKPYYQGDFTNFAPRVGFAYSPFGDNKTSIRAAFGLFYTPPDVTDQVNSVFNPPTALNYFESPQNPYTDFATTNLSNQFPQATIDRNTPLVTNNWPLPALSLFTVTDGTTAAKPKFPTAIVEQWQLSVQREVANNLVVELGYVGSHGYNGQKRIDFNQGRVDNPGEITPLASRLPYPSLSPTMFAIEHTARNSYNAATVRVERRFEAGFSLLSSYTFAKTLDDYGNLNDFTGFWAQNAYNPAAERGLSAINTKHRLTAGYIYEIPVGRGKTFGSQMNRYVDAVVGGWQISGITTFQTGNPIALNAANQDESNTGQILGARPDQVGPVHYFKPRSNNLEWFNTDAFQEPAFGTFGDARRGAASGPGINNWDIAISKYFALTERARLQFQAQGFNAFNHAQFSGVSETVGAPQSGFVTSTTGPRNVQLALRLEF